MSHEAVEVVVVGGGAAGLSAAVALARFRRDVVVVDEGRPRNAPADGVHNLLTRDGMPPFELQALGRAEVERYGGRIRRGQAVTARRNDDDFEVELADGDTVSARRLIVATGLSDQLPDVDGLGARWGRDVVHCPYCHGWEVRDTAVGVLATTVAALHQVLLFRRLTDRVTYLAHTAPPLGDDQREQLDALGVDVVEGRVARLLVDDDRLAGVVLDDGRTVPVETLAVGPAAVAQSPVLDALGLERRPHPLGAELGAAYPSEPGGITHLPGVYLAGNVTDLMAQVVSAAAAGLATAAQLNRDLVEEDVRRAVEARRVTIGR